MKTELDEFVYPRFEDSQLREFKDYLEKFRITKTLSNGEECTYIDELQWLIKEGAIGKKGGIILGTDRPNKYQLCMDKIKQLNNYYKRKAYGKRMAIEEDRRARESLAESFMVA